MTNNPPPSITLYPVHLFHTTVQASTLSPPPYTHAALKAELEGSPQSEVGIYKRKHALGQESDQENDQENEKFLVLKMLINFTFNHLNIIISVICHSTKLNISKKLWLNV